MLRVRQVGGRVVLLATGALVAAAVTACGGNQTAAGGASAPGAAPNQSATADNTAESSQPSASAPQGGGSCHAADLTAKLGTKKELPVDPQGQLGAAGTHYALDLVWTNKSSHSCTMHGFGGVDLDGPAQPPAAATYSLPRNSDTPATVTLAPGASAHSTIQYIDPSSSPDGPKWTPTHLMVTPPNDTSHISVPWTAGTPVYQSPQDGMLAANVSVVKSGA